MDDPGVELIHRAYETWNAEGVAALAERYWDPDIEYHESPAFPDAGVHHGREAVLALQRERLAIAPRVTFSDFEVTPLRDGRYLARFRLSFEAQHSGVALSQDWWQIVAIRGGRVTELREFTDEETARTAAGL